MCAPMLPKMLWYASGSVANPAFWMMRMSKAPVTRAENTDNITINDKPRATKPATERVRSSAHVSRACDTSGIWNFGFFSALGARFLRFPLPEFPLPAVS